MVNIKNVESYIRTYLGHGMRLRRKKQKNYENDVIFYIPFFDLLQFYSSTVLSFEEISLFSSDDEGISSERCKHDPIGQ